MTSYIIDKLYDNLVNLYQDEKIIWNNYFNVGSKNIDKEAL